MKRFNINILLLTFVVVALLLNSCKKDDDWGGSEYKKFVPSNLTDPVVTNIVDTGFTVTFTAPQEGFLHLYFAVAGTESLDSSDVMNDSQVRIGANASDEITYTFKKEPADINPGDTYDVFAVYASTYGALSKVNLTQVKLTDNRLPYVVGGAPAHQSTASSLTDSVVIYFNEPVEYVPGVDITLVGYRSGVNQVLTGDDIIVRGNEVTLRHEPFLNHDLIIVIMDPGSFVDRDGNVFEGLPFPAHYFVMPDYQIEGTYYVASMNEIGFGDGEKGGYTVEIENIGTTESGEYILRIYGVWSADYIDVYVDQEGQLTVPEMWLFDFDFGGTTGEYPIYCSGNDPFGIGGGSGYIPGSVDYMTGELHFFVYFYFELGQFGFYTMDLEPGEGPPALSPVNKSVESMLKHRQLK